jgi:Ku70/Ku80 beta-barrel domain
MESEGGFRRMSESDSRWPLGGGRQGWDDLTRKTCVFGSYRRLRAGRRVARRHGQLYLNNPYYIVPDGEVGTQAFAVIREAIKQEGMVAIGKVVFTSREHIIALEPRGKGMMA